MLEVRVLEDTETAGDLRRRLRAMVEAAFDGEFSDDDWDHTCGGRRVIVVEDDRPVAHAAVVPRTIDVAGRRFATGYVEGVATEAGRHDQGLGTRVMERADDVIRASFELGALSTGRHAFYERVGWERWQGPVFVRDRDTLIRTPDEDDGVMVLRFGPSAAVDLTAPITCEARRGDDW